MDFSTSDWTEVLTASGGNNNSSISGGTITATKDGATGGVQISVTLASSISTVGFEGITISFTGSSVGSLEWNYSGGAVSSTDGLIISGDGVTISTDGINGNLAETDFDNGTSFPSANFGTDFSFDASVDNSAITDLTFVLQVNAGPEVLSISNVQIHGIAVPEPSATVLLGLGGLATLLRRRR